MDVQTQIVDESGLANQVNMDARVAAFKETLAQNRAALVQFVQEYQGLSVRLRDQISGNEQTVELFKTEAYAMYPELITQNIDSVLQSVSSAHPLAQLWSKYQVKVSNANSSIQVTTTELSKKKTQIEQAEQTEKATLDAYAMFARYSPSPVPSVIQIKAEIDSEAAIPYVEEGSVVASIPALELLDPAAADMVTLQAVKMQEHAEIEDALAKGEITEEDYRVYMASDSGMPLDTMSMGVASIGDTWKKYAMYGGAALAIYFLFLRKD